MKKPIIFVLLAVVALTAIQWRYSADDSSPNAQLLNETPLIVDNKLQNLKAPPAAPLVESNKSEEKENVSSPIHSKGTDDEPGTSAKAYQGAIAEYDALDNTEKLERKKSALAKIISGVDPGVAGDVALQQDWERAGRAEPGYQHTKADSKIDVNGTIVDVAQPGIVVADSVMVYIPKGQSAVIAELAAVAGIKDIQPLFKNAKPSTTPGVRDLSGWQQIELIAPADRIKSIVKALKSFDGVSEAEPVYERKLSITPPLVSELNDPMMSDQWHLDAANIKQAWAYLEANDMPAGGSESITIAVIDTGVDYNHPDLSANMWVNTQEIPGNNIDDDNNGFVDDIHGASVVSESFSHSGDPNDDHGHGTHVAGIIAATGANGEGGVGVAYNSKIMAIKAAQYSGTLTTADIAEGIYYAVDNGADIINMSFGGYGRSQVEEDALSTAYSQAVLVAAAGNDARPNDAACRGAPMYPGAHAWVLGVMAHTELPNAKGDYLAGFSNWDCTPSNGLEYELMAPGAKIWSTLPDSSYSAWSGTSMAAPVVAGMAALARTRWPDKSVYSSRFIMGQVGATGGSTQAFTPIGLPSVFYLQADAYNALTSTPKPELSYEEHWLFDEVAQGEGNDGDGRVDAGETVELAIIVRNRWGKADNMVATLSTPSGASAADPYVTFGIASVNYGAVGSFNKDDNGIEYDEDLLVTGVRNPFIFSVAADTPNNHIIPFTLTMTASNGLDSEDATSYSFESKFQLIVQRGRELPSIIASDAAGTDGGNIDTDGIENGIVTIDDSALWIVDKPILISEGTTLKVTEGAQIQFWSSLPDNAYSVFRSAYLQIEGVLDLEGTAEKPVSLFPSALFPTRGVGLLTKKNGSVTMSYTKATNLVALGRNFTKVEYSLFDRLYADRAILFNSAATSAANLYGFSGPALPGHAVVTFFDGSGFSWDVLSNPYTYTGNRIYKIGYESPGKPTANGDFNSVIPKGYDMSLVQAGRVQILGSRNSVFLKNVQTWETFEGKMVTTALFRDRIFNSRLSDYVFKNNAILNVWNDLNVSHWGTFVASRPEYGGEMDVSDNYWGGASDALVDIAITDFSDNFNLTDITHQPSLDTAPVAAYPFVVKVEVLDADGVRPSADRFGAQASKWRVTFNRDMDMTKQPLVTFGPAEPFTDFSIPGDWVDARTWEGTFTFNAITGDGWQNIRVVGAVAADNPWLVTGDDSERFRFELITSGTEALNLQASGQAGSVSLSWTQDDFELLHGYNLYRSMSEDGAYTRVNSSTIKKSITAYTDTEVTPGVGHYYYFTVVSDSGESSPSNIAKATPTDTILPVMTHQPESVVSLGESLTLRVTVTDNIAVTAVNIVFRNASSTTWQTRAMAKTDTNRYSVTLEPAAIGEQYLEYYIEGKDSANTALSGSDASPYKVYVSLPSDTDTDGDGVSNAEDAFPYDPSESVDLDDDGVGDNADPDDDGDGHLDTEDAFPRDASEWLDTDQDGLGNNADADDDGDGVNDGQDAFPLDNRGAVDSDGDGLPNQWETDNGLNPNDASDSDSDLDFDGYTALQEFNARTSPTEAGQKTQIVYYEAEPFIGGVTNSMRVYYRTSDGVMGLNGLGLRVHFNSRLIDTVALKDLLLVDLIAADGVAMLDSADFDNDDSTDSYLSLAWAAQSGSSWPGIVPIKLFDLDIDFSNQVTSLDKVNIRFTATSTHPDYGFSGTPLKTTINVNSLDIDGNGDADALSDGLLILRSMFGLTGEPLILNAVPTSAKYTSAADIEARISGLGLLLDVDGDSKIDSLSDGLLILRYLFGLTGTSLTNGLISTDATRTTPQAIEDYLSRLAPNN